MAKPEIPSIVVHNGSASAPGSPSIDISSAEVRSAMSPSIQNSQTEESIDSKSILYDSSEGISSVSPTCSPSLPVTPSSPSPAVSSNSPSVTSSPVHLRSPTPNSSNPAIPEGPGPGGGTTVVVQEPFPDEMTIEPEDSKGLSVNPSNSLDLPSQRSIDSDKEDSQNSSRHRSNHGNKLKLLQRSHAMREDTSPPPTTESGDSIHNSNNLTVCQGPPMGGPGGANRRRLRHQGSGGSIEGSSPCLSRDSSTEYTDNSGVDLLQFIIQTLHKNQKDRMLLLKIEKELINIVKDHKRSHHKFPQMSSYQRMLVHRCAAFFGLDHNVDHVGTCVIVNKTRTTRLPETRFKEHIRDELLPPDEPKRSILRRGYNSFEDPNFRLSDRLHTIESRRSKSFEEREEEYEKVRSRIFSEESFASMEGEGRGRYPFDRHYRRNSHDESRWLDSRHFGDPDGKQYDNHRIRQNRMHKGESFESHDSLNVRSLRPPVFKSNSFGGYSGGVTVLARGDSCASNPSSRLSKQDSTGSRFSDHSSSSGYKTQRQDTSSTNVSNTLSTTPSPTTGQYQHPSFGQHAGIWGGDGEAQPVMWAVTDMEAVPSGAMLINPQSGQPLINSDGSIYRYDPSNPPHVNKMSHHKKEIPHHDKRSPLHDVSESDASNQGGPLSPTPGPTSDHPPISCSSPDKTFSPPHQVPSCAEAPSSTQDENKGGSHETEGYSNGNSFNGKNDRMRNGPPRVPDDHEMSQQVHSYPHHYMQASHVESRPYSRESSGDMSNQFRSMSMSGANNEATSEIIPPSTSSTPISHGYVIPRHQYPQTMYYVPPTSIANLSGGGMKYVYPQYSMVGSQGAPPGPPASHQVSSMTPAIQHLPSGATAPPIAGHPSPHNPEPPTAPINPGYMSSNFVMTYNPNGIISSGGNSGNVQESGGTTYYPIPGPAHLPPTVPGSTASVPPPTTLQQFALAPTTTTASSYPMALNFYSAGGLSNNGMYQTPANLQGYPGGMYPPQAHTAAPQTGVSYRAPTPPPHTPTNQNHSLFGAQGVGIPITFNSNAGVAPPGSQYIVLPSQQQPASHPTPPHVFPTFFRPSMQMMSGSTPPPPTPQPILQYGGVTPHAPVFAKPYVGAPPLKEESKRYAGSVGLGSGHPLLRTPSFMQNNVAGTRRGEFRPAPPLLSFVTPGPLMPLNLTRPPYKFKRQRSRTITPTNSREHYMK